MAACLRRGDRSPRREVQAHDSRHHERHADRPERREPLVEYDERDQRHEGDAETAGDRVDAREVTVTVGAPEGEEVDRMDHDRRKHEGQRRRRRARRGQAEEADGQEDDRSDRHRRPEEDELVLRPLRQGVPDRVKDRGGDDKDEGGAGHAAILSRIVDT